MLILCPQVYILPLDEFVASFNIGWLFWISSTIWCFLTVHHLSNWNFLLNSIFSTLWDLSWWHCFEWTVYSENGEGSTESGWSHCIVCLRTCSPCPRPLPSLISAPTSHRCCLIPDREQEWCARFYVPEVPQLSWLPAHCSGSPSGSEFHSLSAWDLFMPSPTFYAITLWMLPSPLTHTFSF